MKLGRHPGAFTAFIDSFTGETLLRLQVSSSSENLASYRLYDRRGELAAETEEPKGHPGGLTICDAEGEQLLVIHEDPEKPIEYCLYSSQGALLTCSDGLRTQIFGGFHIEGNRTTAGRPPSGNSKRAES